MTVEVAPQPVESHLPLPTLLSQALVAYTIELDNEFEHLMPHRTTNHGATPGSWAGPWLVSLVMWANCVRFIGDEGVSLRQLERLARTRTNLDGMRRWGYITIEPDPTASRTRRVRPDALIRLTERGRQANRVWSPLPALIERRWRSRFGDEEMDQLRAALWAIAGELSPTLPDCLPILRFGLFSGHVTAENVLGSEENSERAKQFSTQLEAGDGSVLPLFTLLSRVLLAFAIEVERESELSLAICADVLRLLSQEGVRVRDLPSLSGVSKEAISMGLGVLQKKHFVVVEIDPSASRTKLARLTPAGVTARADAQRLVRLVEGRWEKRFGPQRILALRQSLEPLVAAPPNALPPLFRGLEPYPAGWRASRPKPSTLPHYPMVLHRGGFPDGS